MLKFFLSTRPIFHIIAVTETKLEPNFDTSWIVHLDNYVLLRRDRNKNGGGVALYIYNSATILCSSDGIWTGKPRKPEYLLAEINIVGHPSCFAAVVYRPPHAPFIRGTDFIEKLTTHMHDYSTKIIMGDFNADQLCSSADTTFVRRFIDDNGLRNIPYGATFHRETSDTWLDLCLVDEQDKVVDYWKSESSSSDGHDLLTATLDLHTPEPTQSSFSYRDYKAISASTLTEYLKGLDWSVVESAPLKECVSVLQMHIKEAVESLAPLKTVSPGKKRHPWFTTEHQSMIQECDCLYRRFRRTRLPLDLLTHRQARDVAHRTIEEARLNYHHARLSWLTDAKDIWRELEHLGISGSKKKSLPLPFTTTELNAHFRSVSFDQDTPPVADFQDSLASSTHSEQFSFDEFEISDVVDMVAHFKIQAREPDGIPQHVIQLALPFLEPIIYRIVNRSMREALFPCDWKKSIVIALSKVSSPSCRSDFRPISLLSFLSKTLEWLAQD